MKRHLISKAALGMVAGVSMGLVLTDSSAQPVQPTLPIQPIPIAPPFFLIPQCSGRTATVYVRPISPVSDGLDNNFVISGGIDNGMPYRGRLRGNKGADVMVGTAGPDIIDGLGGNDRICGDAGDDIIAGRTGRDRLFGQAGKDSLNGGAGIDQCGGDPSEDTFASCERIVSCRKSGCTVPVTCNVTTLCDIKVDVFVDVRSVRLNDIAVSKTLGRIRFASAVAAGIPPFEIVNIRSKLTKRGRTILRANRNRTVKGRLVATDAMTGAFISNTSIRLRLR